MKTDFWETSRIKPETLTQEQIKNVLSYDEFTGIFTWINKPSPNAPVNIGERADKLHKTSGYHRIQIFGRRYQAHRLAWLYMYGEFPSGYVDHKNTNKTDNSKTNLRLAEGKNALNSKVSNSSTTGIKGVSYHKLTGKFMARIQFNKEKYNLGLFNRWEDAEDAVRMKRIELHGEFVNHG